VVGSDMGKCDLKTKRIDYFSLF